MTADAEETRRVTGTLRPHFGEVQAFLRRVTGDPTQDARVGTCSFRPIEEKGRNLDPHADNELVHVDAGAYGAADGDRAVSALVAGGQPNGWRDTIVSSRSAPVEIIVTGTPHTDSSRAR